MRDESQPPTLTGFDPRVLFSGSYAPFPGAALLALQKSQEEVLGRCSAVAFSLTDRSNELVYGGITFLAPPLAVWPLDEDSTFDALVRGIADVMGEIPDACRSALRARFSFARLDSLDSANLIASFASSKDRQFTLIPCATLYKNMASPAQSYSHDGIRTEEDLWVPDAVNLATELLSVAEKKSSFVLLTSDANPPVKQFNLDKLGEVPELSFVARGPVENISTSQLGQFSALAATGRIDEALTSLEQLSIPGISKKQARLQLLNRAGNSEAAAAIIRELLGEISAPAAVATQWAAICFQANDFATCSTMLDTCMEQVSAEEGLAAALQMAGQMGNDDLAKRARARLEQLFPTSGALRSDTEIRLLNACSQRETDAQSKTVSRDGFEAYQHYLADKFKPGVDTDGEEVVREFKGMWPVQEDVAWMCASLHAEANDDPVGAMNAAMELIPRSRFSAAGARVVARSMQMLLIADAIDEVDREQYQHPLQALITHLAAHPADAYLRAEVLHTVSVEVAGPFGERLLGALAYSLHREMPGTAAEPSHPQPATDAEFEAFLSRFGQLAGQNFLFDPKMALPAEVAGDSAAKLALRFRSQLERDIVDRQRVEELSDFEWPAHLLPPLARHVDGCADDLHALRALAGRHAMFGSFQRARDLAELVLQVAGDSPARRRLAWGAYADIYLRSHSFANALLGLACAADTRATLPASDLYQESYMLMRVARMQGLQSRAGEFMQRSRQLQQLFAPGETTELRLEVASLGLRQAEIASNDVVGLSSLLQDCQRALTRALKLGDELFPPTFLCAQVAGLVERAGGQRPSAAWELVERALQILGPDTATYVRAVSAAVPASEDLVATHDRINNARYAEDAPSDAVAVIMATRRLLRSPQLSVSDAFLACELLAERGLTLSGARAPLLRTWPEQFAQSISQQSGAAVLMLALDDQAELVGAVSYEGTSGVLRPTSQQESFRARIQAWSRRYPYAYGDISPRTRELDERTQLQREIGDQEFYDSMRPFDVLLPEARHILVVAEPEVAQLSFNLLLKDRELAGYSVAFGMVPSLTWLAAARQRPRNADVRRLAWISAGKGDEDIAVTEVVKSMTEETLQRHGVTLDRSKTIPRGFDGAQMAIITAHGQLMPDKKFFHRIADDGDLQESFIELAEALRDVELVVLFVCSGGRIDRHPVHSTTVGLPKMLLDKGCRTVIASPWPLEALAPGSWLPAFLEHWENGATALDACHEANLHVARRRDREPQVSLAMSLYGDPLLVNGRQS